MEVEGFIWYRSIIDKLLWKHTATHEEVEELFNNGPIKERTPILFVGV